MKSIEIIGFKRANLGKNEAKQLRKESLVPCVLYGGETQVHFSVPMILFKEIAYTPEVHIIDLNIEGTHYRAVLQDIDFHPVNDMILHADFLQLFDDKPVKLDIPLKLVGSAPGVQRGGKLVQKQNKIKLMALPNDLPDYVELDISKLELGKSAKVREIIPGNYKILTSPLATVATVTVPRALRGKQQG